MISRHSCCSRHLTLITYADAHTSVPHNCIEDREKLGTRPGTSHSRRSYIEDITKIGGVRMSYARGVGFGANFFAFAIVIYVLLVIILRAGFGFGGYYGGYGPGALY